MSTDPLSLPGTSPIDAPAPAPFPAAGAAGRSRAGTRAGGATARRTARGSAAAPTLRFERSFSAAGYRYIAGCDEVGRGSLAGPVSVGIVVIDPGAVRALKGVRDSKLLSVPDRELLVPRIRRWAAACAVGHASAAEIDEHGLMAALRLAGNRAWRQVLPLARPELVILDGNHDWLSGQGSLFDDPAEAVCDVPVVTRIKADLQCLSVAAASVLAKVERDAMMIRLAASHPGYGWEVNKGYATEAHRAAISGIGPSALHRMTWRLGAPEAAGASAMIEP